MSSWSCIILGFTGANDLNNGRFWNGLSWIDTAANLMKRLVKTRLSPPQATSPVDQRGCQTPQLHIHLEYRLRANPHKHTQIDTFQPSKHWGSVNSTNHFPKSQQRWGTQLGNLKKENQRLEQLGPEIARVIPTLCRLDRTIPDQ